MLWLKKEKRQNKERRRDKKERTTIKTVKNDREQDVKCKNTESTTERKGRSRERKGGTHRDRSEKLSPTWAYMD